MTQIDLMTASRAPAARMLLIERDDLPRPDAWARQLRALGADVAAPVCAGYAAMMQDPHKSIAPGTSTRA